MILARRCAVSLCSAARVTSLEARAWIKSEQLSVWSSVVFKPSQCPRRPFSSSLTKTTSGMGEKGEANRTLFPDPQPPKFLNDSMLCGVYNCLFMYMKYGIGRQRLQELYLLEDLPLVHKWQKCMEVFLGVQLHVLAGLGYKPDETGINMYNQHVNAFVHGGNISPEKQEEYRILGRDLWRLVLGTAFNVDLDTIEEIPIDKARSIMHKVAERMIDPEVLDFISAECATIEPDENPQLQGALRHHVIQEALIYKVYFGGSPETLLEECGFALGEEGYVRFQLAMANHQADPLVAQYMGNSMLKLLKAAGLSGDVATMKA